MGMAGDSLPRGVYKYCLLHFDYSSFDLSLLDLLCRIFAHLPLPMYIWKAAFHSRSISIRYGSLFSAVAGLNMRPQATVRRDTATLRVYIRLFT